MSKYYVRRDEVHTVFYYVEEAEDEQEALHQVENGASGVVKIRDEFSYVNDALFCDVVKFDDETRVPEAWKKVPRKF
jgi:hypothetical protein